MDQEAFLTPRKIFQKAFNAARKSAAGASSPSVGVYTPTTLSRSAAGTNRYNLLPIIQTPPSRLVHSKVINPFEAHLAERLHLPAICSPSLFHRPSTPQTGSTPQFEWTIEEVSSLGPANLEPHETQFMETPDPVLEAQAQAAISTYFKEHSIVPSPDDCQLRNQKIILKNESSGSDGSTGRKSKRKRDGIAQTILSFPPNLPKEIEDLLAPYFSYHSNQQQKHKLPDDSDATIDHEARDASLRRKLFNCSSSSITTGSNREDSLDQLDLGSLSPAPGTPDIDKESVQQLKRSRCFGSQEILVNSGDLSISPVVVKDKGSFGALSPISKSSTSPSPLKPNSNSTEIPDQNAIYRSTPERPKSAILPMNCSSANSHHMSVELNDSHRGDKQTDITVEFTEEELSYEDNLLASSQSSSSMSQHPTTPLRPTSRENRRNRKNLSRSFLLYSDEDRLEEEREQQLVVHDLQHRKTFGNTETDKENIPGAPSLLKVIPTEGASGTFYRMDSGFNEETRETAEYETDVSMHSDCFDRTTPQSVSREPAVMTREGGSQGQHNTGCAIRL